MNMTTLSHGGIMSTKTFENLDKEKKQKIIDAAILEFSRTIPDHINIQNIIKDAHIPRGSFYQYFRNKKDLYIYIFKYIGEKKQSVMGISQIDPKITFLEMVKTMYVSAYQFMLSFPLLYQAGKNMMTFKYYEQFEFIKDAQKQSDQFFVSLIKKDQEKKIINPRINPQILTDMIFSFLDSNRINDYYKQGLSIVDFKHKLDEFITILKKGIE